MCHTDLRSTFVRLLIVASLVLTAGHALAGDGLNQLAGEKSPLKKGEVIAFFGDSITQAGARPGGYCRLVDDAITAGQPDLGVKIVYAGISGHKVPNLQGRLDRDVLSKNPTVVFIYIGINDVWHSTRGRGTPKDLFEAGLRDLIKKITDKGATVVLATPSVIGEKTDGSNPLDPMLEEYAAISRKVAAETDTTLCDLRKAFIDHAKKNNPENKDRGILTGDTVHLNADGNKFVAEQAAAAIATALAARGSEGTTTDDGFVEIFDGKTLDGWDGNPAFWRVEDGCIVGETTADNRTKGNTFIIWRGGKPADFELKVVCKLTNHNSGIQVRSFENEEKYGKWVVGGYQGDLAENPTFFGIIYGEKFRGILAHRGDKVVIGENHKPKVVGKVGDKAELLKHIDIDGWNEFHITAKGNHIVQKINGHVMAELTDDDVEMRRADGLIALQLHAGPPMKVAFRSIKLKELKKSEAETKKPADKKKIVLIAGPKSHGYASHEHNAGCLLMGKLLEASGLGIETTVHVNGWPEDPKALDGADAIVMFCDGGGRHIVLPHLKEVDALAKKGLGITCLHYGVETTKGEQGDHLKEWTGGYFETHWSVNPHWTAHFKEIPEHPVTRGVKPFWMDDEWYYHMRFVDDMQGVTPILTATPPDSTRERRDGPHSNNPTVRSRKGMPEHVAWVRERPDGGRGFGFTGLHWHWSWADDDFRTVLLNGIAWTAGIEIPTEGVPSKRPTIEELKENQDYEPRAGFDFGRVEKLIKQWETLPAPPVE